MVLNKKEEVAKRANAILYPDKIVIETWNISDWGSAYLTDNLTVLQTGATETEIGFYVKKHLQNSILWSFTKEELMQTRKNYKKKLKVKTEKALFQNAKCVAVSLDDKKITLNSYKNRVADRIFLGNPPSILNLDSNINDESLGKEIKIAWEKCEII